MIQIIIRIGHIFGLHNWGYEMFNIRGRGFNVYTKIKTCKICGKKETIY